MTSIARILLLSSGSTVVPHMIRAFGSTLEYISSTTRSASLIVISSPPVTLTRAPVASEISTSSSGELRASTTAFTALFSPSASPRPIIATPPLFMTVFRSAKSRLTKPGLVIISVMPLIDLIRTSSATLKAAFSERLGTTSSNLSFGMTITVSQVSLKRFKPTSAFSIRIKPSTLKGRVTTPIVKAPVSLAICEMTGAEPVPVPPPSPQVTKTISARPTASRISFSLSRAASSPIWGREPAPRP